VQPSYGRQGVEASMDNGRVGGTDYGCMKLVATALGAMTIVFRISSAHAEMDAHTFLRNYDAGTLDSRKAMEFWLSSIELGMDWENSILQHDHRVALYCTPPKLNLTGNQLVDMVRRYTTDIKPADILPVGLVMLDALETTFPCDSAGKSN
jgi:hypothetical protein